MDNLYDKIYEAINNGIQKALILGGDDVSISWHKKKTSGDINMLAYYVKCLKTENDIETNYNQIINCYNANPAKKYVIKDFDEFDELHHLTRKLKNFSIKWMNLSNLITVILDDNSEISADMFNADLHTCKFIKLKNKEHNDILLHKDLLKTYDLKWTEVSSAEFNDGECINEDKYGKKAEDMIYNDYDGYEHTYNNYNITVNSQFESFYQAFNYCKNLSYEYPGFEGYLPSTGELSFILINRRLIQSVLDMVNGAWLLSGKYWTSTEYSHDFAWIIDDEKSPIKIGICNKCERLNIFILPVFRQK